MISSHAQRYFNIYCSFAAAGDSVYLHLQINSISPAETGGRAAAVATYIEIVSCGDGKYPFLLVGDNIKI